MPVIKDPVGFLGKVSDVLGEIRDFNPVEAIFGGWTAVESSNIEAYRYNPGKQELQVRFHGGRVYSYAGVPQSTVDGFAGADSKGHFLNTQIKHQYAASRG